MFPRDNLPQTVCGSQEREVIAGGLHAEFPGGYPRELTSFSNTKRSRADGFSASSISSF